MTTLDSVISKIHGPLFRDQRQTLQELIEDDTLNFSTIGALEGIQNLLDYIADYAHDQFGIDCLLSEPEPEEIYPYEDWQYAVANGDTKLGYTEWLEHRIEMNEEVEK